MRATKIWILVAATAAAGVIGCSSSGNNSPDGGGGGGGQGGQGAVGGQAAGAGGAKADGGSDRMDAASGFMAFAPCTAASAYVSNTTDIAFGGTVGFNYSPACLKIAPGATVTFSGDFATHPLIPSTIRITASSNPIVMTTTGTTKSFTFDAPGFYGYFCGAHGDDQGDAMSGVIWVQ
jgi:plastocyanin